MTDYKKLCAELADELHDFQWAVQEAGVGWACPDTESLIDRARAALAEADEPAVPEGWEPASVTGQPSDEDSTPTPTGEVMGPTYDDLSELCSKHGLDADSWSLEKFDALWEVSRAVLARWGNPVPAPPADVSQLSDGYHTFAELYEHRHSLMLALMRAQPHICWFSRRHTDGELPFGSDDWFIVGAELPGAPITYHLPAVLYSLAQKTGAIELPTGRPWDGHTAADVVQRLRDWAITPTPPADGEVAKLVEFLREQVHVCLQVSWTPGIKHFGRAAELLQRQALVPVSVSERLPGPEDCAPWPKDSDASAWCWAGIDEEGGWNWEQLSAGCLAMFPDSFTHWLPAHALPIPQQQETNND